MPGKQTRRTIVIGSLVVIAAVVGAYSLAAIRQSGHTMTEGPVPWLTDYGTAVDQAKRKAKPLMVEYSASWCPPCRRMDSDVYSRQDVAQRISEQFVPVKLDVDSLSDRENQLAARLGVRAIPIIVIMSPEGRVLGKFGGYIAAERLFKWFDSFEGTPAARS